MYNWEIEIDSNKCKLGNEKKEKGMFIGNGKLGMFADFIGCGLQQCMIAGDFKTNQGLFTTNTFETFRTSDWKPYNPNISDITINPIFQKINLKTAILTTENEFVNNITTEKLTISSDIYAVRQMPYCVVQTLRFSSEVDVDTILFHDIYGNSALTNVDFAYNVIDVDTYSNMSAPLSILTGRGFLHNTEICFASCIVFEDKSENKLLGYNRYVNDMNKCYVKTNIKCGPSYPNSKLHCMTIHMTSFDFENPYDECKKVMLSILNRPIMLSLNTIQRIREDHISMWAKLWNFNININKKNDVDEFTDRCNKKLKQDLYLIFSCTRDNIEIEVNPSTFGVIDPSNGSIYDGDLFLVPLLKVSLQ